MILIFQTLSDILDAYSTELTGYDLKHKSNRSLRRVQHGLRECQEALASLRQRNSSDEPVKVRRNAPGDACPEKKKGGVAVMEEGLNRFACALAQAFYFFYGG